MIGMLTGTVLMVGLGEAIIDVGGVGYLVQCGSHTLSTLSVGAPASLHIETHVREQAITLFGFATEEARAWYVRLQSVQGVGPKAALAILDVLSPADILSAASLEDKSAFARANGVGPKLAGRIATELSGKAAPIGRGYASVLSAPNPSTGQVATPSTSEAQGQMHMRKDAVSALVNLGIGESDALRAVASASKLEDDFVDVGALVKQALKELSQK